MNEDQVERRLRHLLSTRAGQVDPALSGPQLRVLAGHSHRPTARIMAAVLAAAAVVVLAVALQVFTRRPDGPPRPQQPGNASTSQPASRPAPISTAPLPTRTPTPPALVPAPSGDPGTPAVQSPSPTNTAAAPPSQATPRPGRPPVLPSPGPAGGPAGS